MKNRCITPQLIFDPLVAVAFAFQSAPQSGRREVKFMSRIFQHRQVIVPQTVT